jgi:hypothetical protein
VKYNKIEVKGNMAERIPKEAVMPILFTVIVISDKIKLVSDFEKSSETKLNIKQYF